MSHEVFRNTETSQPPAPSLLELTLAFGGLLFAQGSTVPPQDTAIFASF